jgi:predicted metalloprotease
MKDDELWGHARHCPCKQQTIENRQTAVKVSAQLLLAAAVDEGEQDADFKRLKEQVLIKMHKDKIYYEIVNDTIIRKFGTILLSKLGPKRQHDIAQRMRQLARVKIEVNKTSETADELDEMIKGPRFDAIVNAVKCIAELDTNEEGVSCMGKPGLALRIGHNLKKAAQIKYGFSLRNENATATKDAETFQKLYAAEWNDTISGLAFSSLKLKNINTTEADTLPMTTDLVKLKKWLDDCMPKVRLQLETNCNLDSWIELCKLTLARVLLLNKRRGAEAAKILLRSYLERPDWRNAANDEVLRSLLPIERKLFER